jgi:hypothetical protein
MSSATSKNIQEYNKKIKKHHGNKKWNAMCIFFLAFIRDIDVQKHSPTNAASYVEILKHKPCSVDFILRKSTILPNNCMTGY